MARGFELVTTSSALSRAAERLAANDRFAIDTESASFHRYNDRIYLIQLATEDRVWIVDPLALSDLDALGAILAEPTVETIFHDADFDLRTLDRDYGFHAETVFDTRIAAELAGEPGVGLAALLRRHFDVKLDKRFQRADWSDRPLSDEMLAYAADDTRYLIQLRDILAARLRALGRLDWATEEFRSVEQVRWDAPDTTGAYLQLKGAKALHPRQRAALRELYTWRDNAARSADRSPFRIASNEALVAAARGLPKSKAALSAIEGVPPSLARRKGKEMLQAVRRALELDEDELPQIERSRRPRRNPAVKERFDRLRALRQNRSAETGLAPGTLCPNATLMALARGAEDADHMDDYMESEMKRWQREVMGDAALKRALDLEVAEGD